MSSGLAIGTVTAVLKSLLENRLIDVYRNSDLGPVPTVTVLPPDLAVQKESAEDETKDKLNLFLYQVTPNIGWRNMDYPARDSQGNRVSYPPLALDLRYLLSAYSQVPYRAEVMLGYSMQVLHEASGLSRELIRNRIAAFSMPPEDMLAASTLAEQIETIKITPDSLSTEEISKLWAAFQTNYRLTVAYQASVVLIETDKVASSPLPVREPRIVAVPLRCPVIETVQPQSLGAEETLVLQGYNLKADAVQVRFGGGMLVTPDDISDTQISVTLPSTLSAGINTVQVVHSVDFGSETSPDLRPGIESNAVAFMLAPTITQLPLSLSPNGDLSLVVIPAVESHQRVVVLLNNGPMDQAIALPERPANSAPIATLQIPMPGNLPSGSYLVRLQVDGVASALEVDTDEQSSTFNQYIGPTLDVL